MRIHSSNEFQNDERKQIRSQDVEAEEAILELNRQEADAQARQQREIETLRAREQAETLKVQSEERLKAELARIKTDEEVAINETPDGKYQVNLDVSLAKFEADGEGQETEVDVTGSFDIALLGEKDDETDVYEVIYLEKYPINEKTQQISIISDVKPVSVGIDPFNKLIDRNPEDNIKAVDS